MKIPGLHTRHLSYCTNIHPGESWAEVKASLKQHLPLIKKSVSAESSFGVGLRLSALAARELLSDATALQDFKVWLDAEGLYIFTVNGFPYSTFHGEVIKEKVYLPDWSEVARLNYTKDIAEILAALLPKEVCGSISSVPVGFKLNFKSSVRLHAAIENLLRFVCFASELEHKTGKHIALALEPEPGCYLETMEETLAFFKTHLYARSSLEFLRSKNIPEKYCALSSIKRYLGVCLDTCHAAVMFEEPLEFARALRQADISIPKVQLTAALKVNLQKENNLAYLRAYAEANYLHQSCVRNTAQEVLFFLDLPEALIYIEEQLSVKKLPAPDGHAQASLQELRSHFHVPVFVDNLEGLQTTQAELLHFIQALKYENFSCHFEVETYTFDVLPTYLLKSDMDDSISRELAWVLEAMA